MTLHKLIKPVILTCALTANICAAAMPDLTTGYNFATIKGGIVSPASAPNGNSNLNIGNSTYTAGVLVGRTFLERFAVDFEYMYRGDNTAKNSSVATTNSTGPSSQTTSNSWTARSNSFMVNLSANLLKENAVNPYVRAGIGLSRNHAATYTSIATDQSAAESFETVNYSGKTTNEFAYQIGAGLNISTSQMFDTQIEYMYINHGKIKTNQLTVSTEDNTYTYPAITGYLQDHVITLGIKFKF